jgi:ubiquinol-cytochrome c reductase iron-sulfur subunit
MRENEVRHNQAPNETAAAKPARATETVGRDADLKTKRWSRKTGWVIEVLLLGWTFARGCFLNTPVSSKLADPVPSPAPADLPGQHPAPEIPVHAPGKSGRAADRNLDSESGRNVARRQRWGTLFVVCTFALGIAGGIGFLYAYWSGGNNQLLGASAAAFLGGFGAALVLYSHWLTAHKEATEPREQLPSSPPERDALLDDYCAGIHEIHRRRLLKWMGVAGTGVFGAMVLSLLRSLGMSPYRALSATVWKSGQRLMTLDGKPISIHSLQPGSTTTVFPESSLGSEKAQTVLIRVQEQLLQLPRERADWAPMGYVAYSRVCTHAGCTVGLFEATTNLLLCPCHQSTFDVLRAATPTGGPAARPLPQLPLYADSDGNLRAAGSFSEPPGPGFWGMS